MGGLKIVEWRRDGVVVSMRVVVVLSRFAP